MAAAVIGMIVRMISQIRDSGGQKLMTVVTRFAPSPTGALHVGNVITASAQLAVRAQDGRALFAAHRRHGHGAGAKSGSSRAYEPISHGWASRWTARSASPRASGRYEAQFEYLRGKGRVYACFETTQELDLKRKVQLGRGLPPVYDRAALALTPDDIAARIAAGEQPHWRF